MLKHERPPRPGSRVGGDVLDNPHLARPNRGHEGVRGGPQIVTRGREGLDGTGVDARPRPRADGPLVRVERPDQGELVGVARRQPFTDRVLDALAGVGGYERLV